MLINLRNALMAGKRLPYDAEVEYLESTGTQWIDTMANTSPTTILEIVYKFSSSSAAIAGGIGLTSGLGGINNNPTRFLINKDAYSQYNIGLGDFAGHFGSFNTSLHTLTLNAQAKTFTVDSDEFTLPATTFTGGFSIPLFARLGPSGIGNFSSGQLYSCKIWDGSTLVRDYIPVRKGTVGYLYDRVTGKLFGNEGTGDFVLGQDVVPVEYIESHGTEWIDTVVNAKQSLKIRAVFETNSTTSYFIYGVRAGDTTITCASGNSLSLGYLRWGTSAFARAISTGLVDITQDSSGGIVNGTSYGYSATQTVVEQSGYTMVLFAGRNSATTVTANMVGKFYSCKIWNNSLPVRSFRPVRVGTEGAMMDVLTRRVYRNAGTGAFGYGNDLKYPIPAE